MHTTPFAGLFDNTIDLDGAQKTNAAQARRSVEFRKDMLALEQNGKISGEALRKFVFEDRKPESFQAAELMEIFVRFRKNKCWEDMLRLVEECATPDFSEAAIVQEFLAVTTNQLKRYDETIALCERIMEKGQANGEVYGALGKAYLQKGNLEKSLEYYAAGFIYAFEYYPGINAAYRQLDLGNFEAAKSLTRMVHLACLRDGVRETMDYWCAITLVEAATIMAEGKAAIDDAVTRIGTMKIEPMQLASTIETLQGRRSKLQEKAQDTSSFDYTIAKLTSLQGRIEFNKAAKGTDVQRELDVSQSFLDHSFGYRHLDSKFVGQHSVSGNIKYKGQLPDHSLSRTDWQEFNNVLYMPFRNMPEFPHWDYACRNMADITDPAEFLAVADKVIRNSFDTEDGGLENIMSQGHADYDQTVHSLFKLSGIRENSGDLDLLDSRTSISVIMALGLGDCRHHAQAKQILFDAWQKNHMNNHLRIAYAALEGEDQEGFERAVASFYNIESMELRTFDVEIDVPVKCNDAGFPVKNDEGCYILDESNKKREPHTMTILLRKDKNHKVIAATLADSFYQNHYPFGAGEIDLDSVHVDENGDYSFVAGAVQATPGGRSERRDVSVTLKPASYAGRREKEANDEYGQLLLFGIPVNNGFDLCKTLTMTREERKAVLDKIRKWTEEAGDIPEILQGRPCLQATKWRTQLVVG